MINKLLLFFLLATPCFAQAPLILETTFNGITQHWSAGANITRGQIVKINSNGQVLPMAVADTSGVFGVAVTSAGLNGDILISVMGSPLVLVDNVCTNGNFVILSSTATGAGHCASTPTEQIVGVVVPSSFVSSGFVNVQMTSFSSAWINFLISVTVANLPLASANAGRFYRITDGTSTADCTNGGGSSTSVCVSNGSSWQTLGGGGGGGGSSSLSGLLSATAVNTLANGSNKQTWNWGAFSGNQTGFQLGESAPGTGSGNILFRLTTIGGSTTSPFQADVNGNGVGMNSSGILTALGSGGINFSTLLNLPTGCATSNWIFNISNTSFSCSQPGFSDLSGIANAGQIPNPAGDLTGTYTATLVTGVHFGATGFSLGTSPTNGQCVGNVTGTLQGVNCSGIAGGPNLSIQYNSSNAFNGIAVPTSPNGVPQILTSTPSGGVGVLATFSLMGVPVNAQSGTTYTIATTDRAGIIKASNASAQTYTATNPSTSGFGSNFPYLILNQGTGTITENASGFTINGGASLSIPPNWNAWHWSDNTNLFALRVPDYSVFPNCTGGSSAMTFNSATGVYGCLTNIVTGTGTTTTIASGTAAMGTGAISSATCASVVTVTATGTATTDAIIVSVNGDPTAITGYVPSTAGTLYIWSYPTTNNVNFKVCNNTTGSITPGALTLNWRVVR